MQRLKYYKTYTFSLRSASLVDSVAAQAPMSTQYDGPKSIKSLA